MTFTAPLQLLAAVVTLVGLLGAAPALARQPAPPAPADAPPPPECRQLFQSLEALEACFQAAQPGTRMFLFAGINLATNYARAGNFPAAARTYDRVSPPGGQTVVRGDIFYHAYRAYTYTRMERPADALPDASLAWGLLSGRERSPPPYSDDYSDEAAIAVLALILPTLHATSDPAFPEALARFEGLEIPAHDAETLANRAATLLDVGQIEASIRDGRRAIAADPNWAPAFNNLCYALVKAGSGAEAIQHCQTAVRLMPDIDAFHHSLASALASVGRCAEADAELARARQLNPDLPLYRQPIACTPASS